MKQTAKRWMVLMGCAVAFGATNGRASTVCAGVRMAVAQEMTLVRQAFEATMEIENNIATRSLQNVKIDVWFTDAAGTAVSATSDANNTNAYFYVRLDRLGEIDNVSGSGSVEPGTTATIQWTIIPSAKAGGSVSNGTLYRVGANLSYKLSGETTTNSTVVEPDVITVRPLPELELDYFLPYDVYGDDAFTDEVEEPIPFSLGLRVRNSGGGPSAKTKVDSGQPRITENERGLLIGAQIEDCEVNGKSGDDTLLAYFGNIPAGGIALARWTMAVSLSGRFVSMNANVSHADTLGGRLTSLIKDTRTHRLVRDVRVDFPGRDAIRDFLAVDDHAYAAYESEDYVTPVADLSNSSLAVGSSSNQYVLTVAATTGAFYVAKTFAEGAAKGLTSVVREDGKTLCSDNAWISQTREHTNTWTYYLNVFDVDGGGKYVVTVSNLPARANRAPVLEYVGHKVTREGEALDFFVRATDVDGTTPAFSALGLPSGAAFADAGAGEATFAWTPAAGQYGVHPLRIVASDGALSDWEIVKIYVGHPGEALNEDGLPESLAHWKPTIHDLDAVTSSGNATVRWESVEGVPYEVYWNNDPFHAASGWTRTAQILGQGGTDAIKDATLGAAERRYYQVVLAGEEPDTNNVWGVIRQEMRAAGFTMVSPPVRTDRRFDGEMGFDLAEELTGSDGGVGAGGAEVYVLQGNGAWRVLYLDAEGVWREADGTESTYELPVGQGFWVANKSGSNAGATFTGPVGNDGTQSVTLQTGFNLIGLSEGKDLPLAATLAAADPQGGASEETADQLMIQMADGSWRFLMYVTDWGAPFDGNWFDFSTYEIVPTNAVLEPGAAYYYLRRGATTELEF